MRLLMQHPPAEHARFIRPPGLPGVEALQATFVSHRYAPHAHDVWTVALVTSGAAHFELGGNGHTAPAGTTFLIPPEAVHTGEAASPGGYTYRVLYLDPARVSPEAAWPRRGRALVVIRDRDLAHTLLRLHATLVMPQTVLEQAEQLEGISASIRRLIDTNATPEHRRVHPTIAAARAYIHAHWRENFTLEELADAVGFSAFHLLRAFRAEVGMPPSAYRRGLRVQAAQHLLRTGTSPARAAAECGFYDQAHLNRHFKRATGVTPAVYMRG
jgi:AraC-like DNA-binding protein